MQTFVMMLGEVEYASIFVGGIANVPYVGVSVITYVFFVLIMPIVLMNLLVGLAVGDIEAVKKDAFLRRLEMQVEMISSVERWMPIRVQKFFHIKSMVRYPRRPKTIMQKVIPGWFSEWTNSKSILSIFLCNVAIKENLALLLVLQKIKEGKLYRDNLQLTLALQCSFFFRCVHCWI